METANSKTILVTGGAGFIGSNFVPYFCQKYPHYHVINLDKLTYAGDLKNLRECEGLPNYQFIKGDICDEELIQRIFTQNKIQGVIHFAAESHVDNSIKGPKAFIQSNIVGTFNLLDAARQAWLRQPHQVKEEYQEARFHQVSTDEVYGTLGTSGAFTETTPYAPNSPYSASKASADFLVRAYHHTYGLNVTTSNCSNNYGPKQHQEKLIPTIIRQALAEKPIPVYGKGENVRDWLYVLDHAKAVDLIFHQGRSGETYNIGTNNELNNISIVKMICQILDQQRPRAQQQKYEELITFVTDRPGHDFRYAIDARKIKEQLGWQAAATFREALTTTVQWYLQHYSAP